MSLLYSRRAAPWLLLAPVLTLGVIFTVMPMGFSVYLSFTNWNAFDTPQWRGLGNYVLLLTDDPFFIQSLARTFLLAVGSAVIGIPFALLLAFALTASRRPAVWRTIFWLPAITNIVAIAYAWQNVLDPTYGLVNRLLGLIGMAGPDWLTQPATALLSVTLVMAWMTLGQNILLFSIGIEAIDPAIMEAARTDGASSRQMLWHITLPLLTPTTLFVLASTLISGMGAFALVLVMTEGGPDDSTLVTALYMYRMAFESLRVGQACAVAILLTLVTLVLALLQFHTFGRNAETPA